MLTYMTNMASNKLVRFSELEESTLLYILASTSVLILNFDSLQVEYHIVYLLVHILMAYSLYLVPALRLVDMVLLQTGIHSL